VLATQTPASSAGSPEEIMFIMVHRLFTAHTILESASGSNVGIRL